MALRLEIGAKYHYLPLIAAVLIPALLTSRGPTILAISLAVISDIILVQRADLGDTVAYTLSLAAIGLAIGEMAIARRSGKASSAALASELRRRDATLKAMLVSTPAVTLNAEGGVLNMSQPACALFQTTEREAAGLSFRDFVPSFHAEAADTPGGDPPSRRQWLGRRADGSLFPVGIRVAYVDADPNSSRVVLTLTDLSDWHAAEARSQQLSEQLNQVWRLNSLGEMAAILSHELNQPLAAAAIYLQTAQTDLDRTPPVTANACLSLNLAKGQVLRAGEVIRHARGLLTVGSQALKPERMTSMLLEIGPMLKLLGPAADAMIKIDIDGENDLVMADRIQFQQALINLVRNAAEAVSGSDRREVHVIGHSVSETHYEVRVEDSGPGVPAGEVERIFAPLTTTKTDGMGLGLSVTRTIVEAHQGTLTVGTSPLGGAVFAFRLQRAEGSQLT